MNSTCCGTRSELAGPEISLADGVVEHPAHPRKNIYAKLGVTSAGSRATGTSSASSTPARSIPRLVITVSPHRLLLSRVTSIPSARRSLQSVSRSSRCRSVASFDGMTLTAVRTGPRGPRRTWPTKRRPSGVLQKMRDAGLPLGFRCVNATRAHHDHGHLTSAGPPRAGEPAHHEGRRVPPFRRTRSRRDPDLARPEPAADEILITGPATTVSAADYRIALARRAGRPAHPQLVVLGSSAGDRCSAWMSRVVVVVGERVERSHPAMRCWPCSAAGSAAPEYAIAECDGCHRHEARAR